MILKFILDFLLAQKKPQLWLFQT